MNARPGNLCLAVLLALAGCQAPDARASRQLALGPLEVDVSGAADDASLSADALVERVATEVERGANRLAALMVRRQADVAQSALVAKQSAPNVGLLSTGVLLDRVTAVSDAGATWERLLRARLQDPDRFAEFDRARTRVLELLREGRIADACAAFPLPSSEHAPLTIEAARLEGVALLLDERFDDAAGAFQRGVDAAAMRPLERSNMLLLASGAADRAGTSDIARVAWREAVRHGAALAAEPTRVCDPAFWVRAVNLRDPAEPWPHDAIARTADVCRRELGTECAPSDYAARADELVSSMVGAQRLARSEWRAALVAFSRAETITKDESARSRLRLGQAEALARLDDPTAAQALLTTLAADPTPAVACAARSVLGATQLELGRTARGLALLQQAVETEPSVDWPKRGRAEANLGLARLMSGDETDGLRRLHAAQARFEADQAFDDLYLCLQNELAYLVQAGRTEEAQLVRSRLADGRLE